MCCHVLFLHLFICGGSAVHMLQASVIQTTPAMIHLCSTLPQFIWVERPS